jgi:4-carboxymuconolactone decarboxylase
MVDRKQRIALCDLSTLTGEDRELMEKNRIQGVIPNIFSTLINHPKLARSWLRFAGYILSRQTLPVRDRELAILRIGWLNQAPYEWEQHLLVGQRAGITAEEIERIKQGPGAPWDRHDAAIMQACDDLYEHSVVAEETWQRLAQRYNTQQMMDLVFTIGQYNLVSWALNSFGVPLDDFLPGAKKPNR